MSKSLKTILTAVLIAVIALSVVFAALSIITGRSPFNKGTSRGDVVPVKSDVTDEELISYARELINVIKKGDYRSVAEVVHPEYGVIFSPYATVNLSVDRCFTKDQVAEFAHDNKTYIWGVYDGSGEPIELTPEKYFARFVFDVDFSACETFGVDEVIRTGNSLENIDDIFPTARYVDCFMPDPADPDGWDWRSLRFVFEEYDGTLFLTAIIHSENTM